jgi:hypothetical protein
MSDRALWRIGTKTLAAELKRRGKDTEAVQRAFLSECDLALLLEEVARRRQSTVANTLFYDAQANGWVGPLGKQWPLMADDDLPFDAENCHSRDE